MIHLSLILRNPFQKRYWNSLRCWSKQLTKNKAIEVQVMKESDLLIEVTFSIRTRIDHGGLTLSLGLIGYSVDFKFYDIRHWNYNDNCWE